MKSISMFTASLCLMGLSAPAYGKTSDFERAFAQQGSQARISFSIPLGNSLNKAKTAPRLNFGIRQYVQPSRVSTDWIRRDRNEYRDVNLGFTFEETPKLMLNDQLLMPLDSEQANISTPGKIGLGVGAVVLVGVAVVAVIFATTDFVEDA